MEKNIKILNKKAMEGIIIFLSTLFILCYLYVLSKRLFYPFELEWLEGYFVAGMIQIDRVYTPPLSSPLLFFNWGIGKDSGSQFLDSQTSLGSFLISIRLYHVSICS